MTNAQELKVPSFSFRIPPRFVEVPLAGRGLRVTGGEHAHPGESDVADLMRFLAMASRAGPVIHASVFAARTDDVMLSAALIVGLLPGPFGPLDAALAHMAQALSERNGYDVRRVHLTCGPALGAVVRRHVHLGEVDGEAVGLDTVEFSMQVPHPASATTLSFVLSTPCADEAELFGEVMANVVRSIRFEGSKP